MPAFLCNLRKLVAAVLVVLALGTALTACADIHPDDSPRSPEFKNYPPGGYYP